MELKCGVVHKDVEFAKFIDGFSNGLPAECPLRNVARYEYAFASFGFYRFLRCFGVSILVQINNGDIGPFSREEHGDRAANPAVAARYQCRLISQLS
jgi:hypothetical protein